MLRGTTSQTTRSGRSSSCLTFLEVPKDTYEFYGRSCYHIQSAPYAWSPENLGTESDEREPLFSKAWVAWFILPKHSIRETIDSQQSAPFVGQASGANVQSWLFASLYHCKGPRV
ncbi:hypothetical protein VTK73DRAFT_3127 [Phialemonium thermophilum]|uniref:Uncharacterized protein n=1 Tax=Phialemonium thermophilum TaxID=223376 RepID=A0ABR3VKP7_9PEZI